MELFSLPTVLFLFLLSFYLSVYFLLPKPPKTPPPPPKGFNCYLVIGHLPGFLHNRHRFLDWTTEVLGRSPNNTAVFRRPNADGVLTANPLVVEHMLKTNFENYPKGIHFLSILGDFLGQGIFNADGENWKHQRKTASYEFNTKSLRSFVMESVKSEVEVRLIPILHRAAAASGTTNRILDMQDVLERFAFDNICKVAFNVDPGCLGGDATTGTEFMQAFEEAATLSSGRFFYAVPFCLQNQEVLQPRLRTQRFRRHCGCTRRWRSTPRLQVVPQRRRVPDGTTLKKGWFLTYSSYAMGRMESIWGKDCCEFKPEKWLENGVCRQEMPFRFPAFHAGPRICLGREMAYIQMKSIAAAVVERFELDVLNRGECPEHTLSLTIRMKGGLPVLVKEKN
ncbi:hypothetical protein RHMOL_Rhmol03G0044300 [Rhododendron molle]|uniref:Uncharacterized protein n=1 Tax=Rhododendron molle TaxID=49168 RepID=A0ACC0PA67_RHOML|nr:hypothetical protein RHMOL_Rhmol03G0044300 [Rhododendron molle]